MSDDTKRHMSVHVPVVNYPGVPKDFRKRCLAALAALKFGAPKIGKGGMPKGPNSSFIWAVLDRIFLKNDLFVLVSKDPKTNEDLRAPQLIPNLEALLKLEEQVKAALQSDSDFDPEDASEK